MDNVNYSTMDWSILWRKLFAPVLTPLFQIVGVTFVILLALVVYSLMKYRVRFRRGQTLYNACQIRRLQHFPVRMKLVNFLRWKYVDMLFAPKRKKEFREFGLTCYQGPQGCGKTASLVDYANWVHHTYPECKIVANFQYRYADHQMQSWADLLNDELRNGVKGTLFLIDEIQAEYSAQVKNDFPPELLAEICMQRKQRIKIAATSQVFARVAKPLREQTNSVVHCLTIAGRWTFCREYDARKYETYYGTAAAKRKLRPFSWKTFVQDDDFRKCYDTYKKIKRLEKLPFIPRHERVE